MRLALKSRCIIVPKAKIAIACPVFGRARTFWPATGRTRTFALTLLLGFRQDTVGLIVAQLPARSLAVFPFALENLIV